MNIRAVLEKMIAARASDLHLKTGSAPVVRVDGVLYTLEEAAPNAAELKEVVNQLLSEEQRQHFATHSEIDFAFGVAGLARFRVNIFMQRGTPALALRHVPVEVPSIEDLHLPPIIRELAFSPRGLILVTGRTGSGKSTTLAAVIDAINRVTSRNVITVEDPIEFLHRDQMSYVHQREVGLDTHSFRDGLRYVLRQDPDIILVGEVRDKETAEMAFRAAMTGHQVFTTLHTNSALGAFPRLLDIGVLPDIMAGNIIGVIAQRLVRVLCTHCKEAYAPSREERLLLGTTGEKVSFLHRSVGCKHCDNKGFKGRSAIMELLVMDSDLDELVARRATAKEMRTAALSKGYRTLADEGLQRVVDGTTSLVEVAREIDLTSRYG